MAITIFYSWQSDLPNRLNRNFIEDALKKAIQNLSNDIQVEAALRDESIVLDKDTKNVPGSPPIAQVIFEKLSNCSAFVPDLSFVGQAANGRHLPNPNVLIEYGWALSKLSHARIVPVMNAEFGKATSESLPFDMRHLHHPIMYSLSEASDSAERARVRKALINTLTQAIRMVLETAPIQEAPPDPPTHQEVPFTLEESTFLRADEPLGSILELEGDDKRVWLLPKARAFLRLIPVNRVEELRSARAALDLIEKNHLMPLIRQSGGWTGRNAYRAFVCDCKDHTVKRLTQLFLNREIWGIDSDLLNKERLMKFADVSFGYFPYKALEDGYLNTLANYLQFASKSLELPLPLRFVAGGTGILDYRMAAPHGKTFGGFEKFGGLMVSDRTVYEGRIGSYETNPEMLLLPFFEKLWDDCGVIRPGSE